MSSMAFTKSTQARHPLTCQTAESLTTLQTSLHAADRPVAPPRFDPGLSTGPGGFTTGDPGVSPNRTLTGWPSRACAQLRHDSSFAFMASPSCWTHVDRGYETGVGVDSSTRTRLVCPAWNAMIRASRDLRSVHDRHSSQMTSSRATGWVGSPHAVQYGWSRLACSMISSAVVRSCSWVCIVESSHCRVTVRSVS